MQISAFTPGGKVQVAPAKSNSGRSWTAGALGSMETTSAGSLAVAGRVSAIGVDMTSSL
jgi:hypothetical protein